MDAQIFIKTLDQVGFEPWEKRLPNIQNRTVLVFSSLFMATHLAGCIVHYDLLPRLGEKGVKEFPLTRSGPARDGCDMMVEAMGLKAEDPEQETWLLIGDDRFPEVYDYIVKQYPEWNPGVTIQDCR